MSAPHHRSVPLGPALVVIAWVASCSLIAPNAAPTSPVALYLENRGGPALTVSINGSKAIGVLCDGYPTLIPGENGVPPLPWDLSITRSLDGVVAYSGLVTQLPAWFVQMGDRPLGLGYSPVEGPAGPNCRPT